MQRCLLLHDRSLNPQEIVGILARLGFEKTYNSGAYSVFDNNRGGVVLIHHPSQWERPFADLARHLSGVGITQTEIEAALESLYADH